MNKKILTAAIGAAMVAGPLAAQADLKISGRVAGSLASFDGTIAFADYGNTRLQFDAKDDSGWYARLAKDMRLGRLRTSLTAITVTVTPTTGYVVGVSGASSADTSLRTDRDQYVGFKADFGSLQFGRMAGAVKNLEGDAFIGTFLELRNNAVRGGSLGSSSFVNNQIQFANKFGDASVKVQYNPVSTTVDSGAGAIALGVKAKMAGAKVFLGYNNLGNTAGASFIKLGGAMKFGEITGRLQYETTSVGGASGSLFVLGGDMSLGDGASVDISYGDRGGQGADAYTRVAYMKKASKKARYWVGYVNNGAQSANATFGAGARVDF